MKSIKLIIRCQPTEIIQTGVTDKIKIHSNTNSLINVRGACIGKGDWFYIFVLFVTVQSNIWMASYMFDDFSVINKPLFTTILLRSK